MSETSEVLLINGKPLGFFGGLAWNTWKLNEPTSSSVKVPLPSDYSELIINVKSAQTITNSNIHLLKDMLSTTASMFRAGYYESSQYNGDCVFYATSTEVWGFVRENNGTIRTTTIDIYYR